MTDSLRTVSMDDDDLVAPTIPKYQGRNNEYDRIAILNVDNFTSGYVHFIQNRGSFICLRSKDGASGPCEKYGLPNPYYVFTVLHYHIADKEGLNLDMDRVKKDGTLGIVKFWKVGQTKMKELRAFHKSNDLREHDLRILCTEPKYQKMTIIPCSDQAYWKRNPKLEKKYLEEVDRIKDQASALLGRRVTAEQLDAFVTGNPMEAYGTTSASTPKAPSLSSPEELADILKSI